MLSNNNHILSNNNGILFNKILRILTVKPYSSTYKSAVIKINAITGSTLTFFWGDGTNTIYTNFNTSTGITASHSYSNINLYYNVNLEGDIENITKIDLDGSISTYNNLFYGSYNTNMFMKMNNLEYFRHYGNTYSMRGDLSWIKTKTKLKYLSIYNVLNSSFICDLSYKNESDNGFYNLKNLEQIVFYGSIRIDNFGYIDNNHLGISTLSNLNTITINLCTSIKGNIGTLTGTTYNYNGIFDLTGLTGLTLSETTASIDFSYYNSGACGLSNLKNINTLYISYSSTYYSYIKGNIGYSTDNYKGLGELSELKTLTLVCSNASFLSTFNGNIGYINDNAIGVGNLKKLSYVNMSCNAVNNFITGNIGYINDNAKGFSSNINYTYFKIYYFNGLTGNLGYIDNNTPGIFNSTALTYLYINGTQTGMTGNIGYGSDLYQGISKLKLATTILIYTGTFYGNIGYVNSNAIGITNLRSGSTTNVRSLNLYGSGITGDIGYVNTSARGIGYALSVLTNSTSNSFIFNTTSVSGNIGYVDTTTNFSNFKAAYNLTFYNCPYLYGDIGYTNSNSGISTISYAITLNLTNCNFYGNIGIISGITKGISNLTALTSLYIRGMSGITGEIGYLNSAYTGIATLISLSTCYLTDINVSGDIGQISGLTYGICNWTNPTTIVISGLTGITGNFGYLDETYKGFGRYGAGLTTLTLSSLPNVYNITGITESLFRDRTGFTYTKTSTVTTAKTVTLKNLGDSFTYSIVSGSTGSWTGSTWNLTEEYIDNLSNGKDWYGSGTTTAWHPGNKVWCLVNMRVSSTYSTVYRYRWTFVF